MGQAPPRGLGVFLWPSLDVYSYDRRRRTAKMDADYRDFDGALDEIKEGVTEIRKHIAQCKQVLPIFQRLGTALEAPDIDKMAARIVERIRILGLVLDAMGELSEAITAFDVAVNKQLTEWAQMPETPKGLMAHVERVPSYVTLKKLSDELDHAYSIIEHEDSKYLIQWTLEDYISSETGVGERLEKIDVRGISEEVIFGDIGHGVLRSWDEEELRRTVEEDYRDED